MTGLQACIHCSHQLIQRIICSCSLGHRQPMAGISQAQGHGAGTTCRYVIHCILRKPHIMHQLCSMQQGSHQTRPETRQPMAGVSQAQGRGAGMLCDSLHPAEDTDHAISCAHAARQPPDSPRKGLHHQFMHRPMSSSSRLGCMVMLMGKLHGDSGLVNGARLIIRAFQPSCVDGEIATGTHRGRRVTSPASPF